MSPLPASLDDGATRELVRRVQAGEQQAWTELYQGYRDELLFYVRARLGRRLRSAVESEDVLQSVALAAFRAMPRFEPRGKGSLRRFLHVLVLNSIRDRADALGAAKRDGAVQPLDAQLAERLATAPPGQLSYRDPVYERLERALAELPDEMREVVLLRRVEERSSREVAERLGKSDEAVRKLYSRALARLSVRLGAADA